MYCLIFFFLLLKYVLQCYEIYWLKLCYASFTEFCLPSKRMSPTEVGRPSQNGSTEHVWHLVVPYSIVFVLAVTGNALVMATLVFNKSMRTVTNIFLFNLAVSDFLLGVFCMPFTLSGVLFREFLFGRVLCKMIPYFQGKNLLAESIYSFNISLKHIIS